MATLEFCLLTMLFTIIFKPLCVEASPNHQVPLFVFGDSMFDAGNLKYLNTSFAHTRPYVWPYGETFFHYPTGRFSDGRLIPDFIADYMKLPLLPPYLQPGSDGRFTDGSNFASAGSGVLSETNPGLVIDLKTQLSHFKNVEKNLRKKLGDLETKRMLSRAIYLFHTGANDYYAYAGKTTVLRSFSREAAYVEMVIGNLTHVIKGIHQSGGTKFGILNVPEYWLVPAARAFLSDAATTESVELVKLHNKQLSKALKELKRDLKAFEYSLFDFYTSLSKRTNSPSKYGFKDAENACCGSGPYRGNASCGIAGFEVCDNVDDYMFFDASHLTDRANVQIAEEIWNGGSMVSRPFNLKTLIQISPKPFKKN